MPKIGNNYVYKTNGVCTLAAEEDRSGTKFYKLIPIFEKTLSIFVPEDKAQLRPPMTKEQAEGLLLSIKDMESVWIEDSRERRKHFGEILSDGDIPELTALLKSLCVKKAERHKHGKYMYSYEENLLQSTMRSVSGEVAYSLGIPRSDAVTMLESRFCE